MKLSELKTKIKEYQYFEDTTVIDVALANIIANSLKIGDPVWTIIIGTSSGGKSQILRPLSLTNPLFIHKIDDLTENTLLSGAKSKGGETVSLLDRIGEHGIISISDFTVLMSKSSETRSTILSQFRMLFDGEMVKYSGNMKTPLRWQGYLGVIAGSTPSIYSHFEDVADMGERFLYYRMKEYDKQKATHLALSRTIYGKELDNTLADFYRSYIKEVVTNYQDIEIEIPEEIKNRIIDISIFAETIRTTTHKDWKGEMMDKIPIIAMPMRVALQLTAIAKTLSIMKHHETGDYTLTDREINIIEWIGYSLANEEKRACLRVIASVAFDNPLTASAVADNIGLDTKIVQSFIQNLSAVGILQRSGAGVFENLRWGFRNKGDYSLVRKLEGLGDDDYAEIENREASLEEGDLGGGEF